MYVCFVCLYVCIFVCLYMYVCMYVCVCETIKFKIREYFAAKRTNQKSTQSQTILSRSSRATVYSSGDTVSKLIHSGDSRHQATMHALVTRLAPDHVVPLLKAYIMHDGCVVLVMPLCERLGLSAPPSQRIQRAIELVECVNALHVKGVVHLDLKPANVVVFNGKAKLIDFEFSEIVGSLPRDYIQDGKDKYLFYVM